MVMTSDICSSHTLFVQEARSASFFCSSIASLIKTLPCRTGSTLVKVRGLIQQLWPIFSLCGSHHSPQSSQWGMCSCMRQLPQHLLVLQSRSGLAGPTEGDIVLLQPSLSSKRLALTHYTTAACQRFKALRYQLFHGKAQRLLSLLPLSQKVSLHVIWTQKQVMPTHIQLLSVPEVEDQRGLKKVHAPVQCDICVSLATSNIRYSNHVSDLITRPISQRQQSGDLKVTRVNKH